MLDRTEVLESVFGVVQSYDEDDALFVVAPGDFGFGVIADPLTGLDEGAADKLNQLLTLAFPAGTLMQFSLFAGGDLERYLTRFEGVRAGTPHPVLKEMTRQRSDFLRGGVDAPIDNVSGVRLHDVRLVISVKIPAGRNDAFDERKAKVARDLRTQFEQTIKSIGFRYERLDRERYLRFMQTVLNPSPTATWRDTLEAPVTDDHLLCEQILDSNNAITVEKDVLWLGEETCVSVLSPKAYPSKVGINMALRYIGDFMTGARGIREPVLIAVNVLYGDDANTKNTMEAAQAWATRNADGPLSKYVPKWRKKKQSIDIAMQSLERGDRLVKAYIGMAIFSRGREEAKTAVANARAYWREMRWQVQEDRYMLLPLFCQLLPLAGDADLAPVLGRYKSFPTSLVVPMLPVLGAWRGTGTPLITTFSRDGQVMAVSPFDSETNYNFAVAAESGAGKSFLVNEIVCSMLASGGVARIIDVGSSYRNICEQLGGQYIEFDPKSRICLNPFPAILSFNEEVSELAVILEIMAAPKQGLTDFQNAALKDLVRAEYSEHGPDSSIDGIRRRCAESSDQRLRDLSVQLASFGSEGEYGRFFTGKNTLDMSNPFIVLELEHLKQQKHLQRVVLLLLMFQIRQQMFMGDIGQQKLLAVDEAWDLLGTEETREFIIAFYRRVRKANGSVGTITQSISDFYRNGGAEAIIENSASSYLLRQSGEALNTIQRENRLDIGEFGYRQLRSVQTIAGEYSEIMFRTGYGSGIGRLVVAPYTQLAYSTKPSDKAAIKNYRDQGLGLDEALRRVLADRERGGRGRRAA